MENGALSWFPAASARVEIDLTGMALGGSGGTIDGEFVGDAVWPAWKQTWAEGGQKSIVIAGDWENWSRYWSEDGWTSMGTGYDVSIGGYVDDGTLSLDSVSMGADVSAVLRRCAGE